MSEAPMKKQALLIGINEYQILPELKYARQDAEAVEQALKQNYCFSDDEVMLLTDAKPGLLKPVNRRIIEKHLENLAEQNLDLFIFGFWGHGLFRNGQRYFCPLDAINEDIEELGLSFDALQELLFNIRAKNTCMILDCCQRVHDRGESEVFTAADQTIMDNAARDIVLKLMEKEPESQSNVAILNSCKEGQSAYEWDSRKHGIFTAHLLDAFNRRYESVSQIIGYISRNVERTAMELGKTQTPYYKLTGDIILPVDKQSSPLIPGDVFVSYRYCNADLISPIEEELKNRGISCFIDREGTKYNMEYSEAIARAIKECKVLLFVWTPDANDSPNMLREVAMALNLKKRVLPYKVGSFDIVDHSALYYLLSPLRRHEVQQQTPATVIDLVNRIELALSGKKYQQYSFVLPEKSEDAVIAKPIIEDINVTFTPELIEPLQTIQYKEITLPSLPQELLDLKAENKGLLTAIDQIRAFTHESLAQANAVLVQAQAQFQAWEERKEKRWSDLSESVRELFEVCISNNPDCTEEDLNAPLDELPYQVYFDFIEKFQCGRKYEQAKRELKRVEQDRQTKCDEAIAKIQKMIADNNLKIKEISDAFFNETLMTIFTVMPGYNDANAAFPDESILDPLRQLEKYELNWSAKETFSRARRLWKEQRPCVLGRKTVIDKIPFVDFFRKNKKSVQPDSEIKAGERKTIVVNDVEFAFRWCPPGSFMMGSPTEEEGRNSDEEQHVVTLTQGFWMMETEVTQKQWKAIMDNNPSSFKGEDNLPVECVSWNDCQVFCRKCAELGLTMKLPTEAQWEYACRAGSATAYFWGNALNGNKANCDGNNPCGMFFKGAYIGKTTPVDRYEPNAWGLFDMHGNVCEWCQDWYDDYPRSGGLLERLFMQNSGEKNDSTGRVLRGGSWNSDARNCRSAVRDKLVPEYRGNDAGFRCVNGQ